MLVLLFLLISKLINRLGLTISQSKVFSSDRLIWISTVETLNFIFNPFSLNITFSTTACNKDTLDYKYRNNAISIGLISDWAKVSCSQFTSQLLEHLNKYKFNHVNLNKIVIKSFECINVLKNSFLNINCIQTKQF